VRNITSAAALAVAVTLMTTSISWAGSAGRRNTALATTALAVGAWSNHTGRAGRKNTAILATAGAAVAWGRYSSKKREENRRNRYARVASRCAPTAWAPARSQEVERRGDHGRHLGWYKHHGHHDDDGDREHHGHHDD
jgi:hypothetical protein